jgi:predicted site-specific integrase-resolvase
MSDIIDRLAPIPEAAQALGVAERTVRWWIQIGKIGGSKPGSEPGNPGGRMCVPVSEINRIIRESRMPARRELQATGVAA